MTAHSLDTLEERIRKPGYLLLLVVVLLLLIVGLVDLIDYEGRRPVVLGRYELGYFIFLVGYTLFTLLWASLLFRPNNDTWLTRSLDFIQQRAWLALGLLALIAVALGAIVLAGRNTDRNVLLSMPAFQAVAMLLLIIAAALILFYNWGEGAGRRWRRIALAGIGLIVAVELALQALAFFGLLPSVTDPLESNNSYTPYGRIYQADEGYGSGLANNYGRYAPNFELLPDATRIALIGDSNVQAIQVSKDDLLAVQLQDRLAQASGEPDSAEVISLGNPDLGPGFYLGPFMVDTLVNAFDPQEAIILFDLANDFQTVGRPGTGYPFFRMVGQGEAKLDESRFVLDIHAAEHEVYLGYLGFQPVRWLYSNFLTTRTLRNLVSAPRVQAETADIPAQADIDRPNWFVFQDGEVTDAQRIAAAQIRRAKRQMDHDGITTRLVTLPAFTADFYQQQSWNTRFGDSDLLLPEQRLRESAAADGLPFLGLGLLMAAQEMPPAQVQELYYADGLGHLTPEGHAFAAQAIFDCFYGQTLGPEQGCDRR